jgi:GPH family glycoside/pentoside/hexuronide:cation symporter
MGLVSGLTILLTYRASKREDPPCRELRHPELPGIRQLFAAYLSILKLSPMRWLVLASICALVCYSMIMSDMVYFMTYNLQRPSIQLSALLLGRPIIGLPLLWIVGKVALKIDKRQTLILFFLTGFAGMVLLRLTPPGGPVWIVFYLLMLAFCTCVYWDLVPSIYFDICEYDKLTTGQDRESMIVSLQGLVEAAALGFGSFLLGSILDLSGFDGTRAVQPASALTWVAHCTTVLPAFFLLLASLAIWKYPITRDVHAEIVRKLAERKGR